MKELIYTVSRDTAVQQNTTSVVHVSRSSQWVSSGFQFANVPSVCAHLSR